MVAAARRRKAEGFWDGQWRLGVVALLQQRLDLSVKGWGRDEATDDGKFTHHEMGKQWVYNGRCSSPTLIFRLLGLSENEAPKWSSRENQDE